MCAWLSNFSFCVFVFASREGGLVYGIVSRTVPLLIRFGGVWVAVKF